MCPVEPGRPFKGQILSAIFDHILRSEKDVKNIELYEG